MYITLYTFCVKYLPGIFPADLNTNSIILQVTCKNTHAIF
nr:MAG TPA: hypothetical protein [Caudoviricetes sp.]